MRCPLCGQEFASWESNSVCTRCPLAGGCHLTRCPRCGYEWAEESRLVSWFQRRWHRWRAARHEHAGGRQ